MKSGKVYYNELNLDLKGKFKINSRYRFTYNMTMVCENFRDFILKSFRWSLTPEGEDYWRKISENEK